MNDTFLWKHNLNFLGAFLILLLLKINWKTFFFSRSKISVYQLTIKWATKAANSRCSVKTYWKVHKNYSQAKNLRSSAGKMKGNPTKISVDLIMFTKEIPIYKSQFGHNLLCSLLLKTYFILSMFLGYVEYS